MFGADSIPGHQGRTWPSSIVGRSCTRECGEEGREAGEVGVVGGRLTRGISLLLTSIF